MAREVLGEMACPECGGVAEVKAQKNGMAYRWCTDCNAQYFPRTAEASDRLLAKCGAKKPAPAPEPAAPTVTAPAPAPAPKAKPKTANPFDFLLNPPSKAA